MRITFVLVCVAACAPASKHAAPNDEPDAGTSADAPSDGGAVSPQLVCTGAGAYCGGNQLANGDPNTLYHCTAAGQPPASSQACSVACERMPPGTDDFCTKACPTGGGYCGDNGLGGPAGFLFHCVAGQAPASYTDCHGTCLHEPQGVDDACAGQCSAAGASALQWEAMELAAGNSYSDLCLGFVNQAYEHAGMTLPYLQQYDAYDALVAARATGHFVGWNGSCPCGAILFWGQNACNGNYGHVVICNGDGTISTAGWPGFAGSTHETIAWMSMEECNTAPAGYILP